MANKKVEKDVEIIEEVTEEVIEDGEVMAIDVVKKPNLIEIGINKVKAIPQMTVADCAKKVVLPVTIGVGFAAAGVKLVYDAVSKSDDNYESEQDPSSYADEMEEVTYTETTEGN